MDMCQRDTINRRKKKHIGIEIDMSKMSRRKEALLQGHKTYIDDKKSCKKCGNNEKYVSSYQCVKCSISKLNDTHLMKEYRTIEKQRQKLRRWRKENPEKRKQQSKSLKSRVNSCIRFARYRARKRNQTLANANTTLISDIYAQCKIITEQTKIPHEVDHIVPISLGGIHHESNLQIITRTENRMKGNRYNG